VKAPLLAPLLAVAVAATATAQTAPTLQLHASIAHRGRIDLTIAGTPGAQVDVADVTGAPQALGHVTLDAQGAGAIRNAEPWGCQDRTRHFEAQQTDTPIAATASVTTPSCAHRYRLTIHPRHPRATRPLAVHITDTFRLAHAPLRVCARGPGRARVCRSARRTARLRLPRPGRWTIAAAGQKRTITVRRRPGHLRLLAAGDSMIQIVDDFLADRLRSRHVGVRNDDHISTGLSKPFMLDWPRHAKATVAAYHPDVTVMFIGANDGFNFGSTGCCGAAWQRKYADVASGMMSTYARHGAGTVFWCLLPAPRAGNFRRVFVAVNHAIHLAARRHPGTVHLVDLPRTFTPGYHFRQTIQWGGKTVSVRQDDGVHLNVAGASIATTLMVRRMVRAGEL
jgi:hypothetical protein